MIHEELKRLSARIGEDPAPLIDVEFIGSPQHGLNGGEELVRPKRLPEHQPADLLDECLILGFRTMTGHEQEPTTKGGFNPFNGEVEFVPWKRGHDHVAEHQVKILNHDSSQSLRAVFQVRHFAGIGFEEPLQCDGQFRIILQKQNVERAAVARSPGLGVHNFERVERVLV